MDLICNFKLPTNTTAGPVHKYHQCTSTTQDLRVGARRSQGVDSWLTVARALPQLRKQARVPLVAFLAVLDGHKTSRAEKIFFVKKMAVWQIWPLNGPRKWANFFYRGTKIYPPEK